MSSLSDAVNDPRHCIAVWPRENFPHHETIQDEFRRAAGVVRVLPARTVVFGTPNIAIDQWIRFLVDPVTDLRMALNGVMMTSGGPGYGAGMELLLDLGAIDGSGRTQAINHDSPTATRPGGPVPATPWRYRCVAGGENRSPSRGSRHCRANPAPPTC